MRMGDERVPGDDAEDAVVQVVGAERRDPRVVRTRQLLQDALLRLARERPLEDIAVSDIAEAATLNRTTFYQHYGDKETLLADALDAEAARRGAEITVLAETQSDVYLPPDVLLRYTEHVAENAALYRRVLGDHGSAMAVTRLRRRIEVLALKGMRLNGKTDDDLGMPAEICAASIAASTIGVLSAWLERDPMAPASDVSGWLWRLLMGAKHQA